jgi:hypothetical protein
MDDVVSAGVPIGRMGQRRDIALSCVYLASSAAAYVSGEDPSHPLCLSVVTCCTMFGFIFLQFGLQVDDLCTLLLPLPRRLQCNEGHTLDLELHAVRSAQLLGWAMKQDMRMFGDAGHVMVVDGAAWLWRPRLVPRDQVTAVSRGVEAKSRKVGTATRSKL